MTKVYDVFIWQQEYIVKGVSEKTSKKKKNNIEFLFYFYSVNTK